MNDFLSLLEKWNQEDKYQKIIDCLETLSNTQELDYTLTGQRRFWSPCPRTGRWRTATSGGTGPCAG